MKWVPEPPMHNLINCNVLAKFPVNEDSFFSPIFRVKIHTSHGWNKKSKQ